MSCTKLYRDVQKLKGRRTPYDVSPPVLPHAVSRRLGPGLGPLERVGVGAAAASLPLLRRLDRAPRHERRRLHLPEQHSRAEQGGDTSTWSSWLDALKRLSVSSDRIDELARLVAAMQCISLLEPIESPDHGFATFEEEVGEDGG